MGSIPTAPTKFMYEIKAIEVIAPEREVVLEPGERIVDANEKGYDELYASPIFKSPITVAYCAKRGEYSAFEAVNLTFDTPFNWKKHIKDNNLAVINVIQGRFNHKIRIRVFGYFTPFNQFLFNIYKGLHWLGVVSHGKSFSGINKFALRLIRITK